jgi:uncharacterized protein YneR
MHDEVSIQCGNEVRIDYMQYGARQVVSNGVTEGLSAGKGRLEFDHHHGSRRVS